MEACSCIFILFLKFLRINVIVLQIFLTKYVAGFNECVVNFKDKSSNNLRSLHLLIISMDKKSREKEKLKISFELFVKCYRLLFEFFYLLIKTRIYSVLRLCNPNYFLFTLLSVYFFNKWIPLKTFIVLYSYIKIIWNIKTK